MLIHHNMGYQTKKKLKILEITAFSAGFCGVWTRVLAESSLLAKKYDVTVFSSNIYRGTEKEKCAPLKDTIGNVKIKRFPVFTNFGSNTYFWNFEKEAINLKPNIIIVHAYRQYYATNALKLAKKLKIPCILVTHAPFLEFKLRSWKANMAVFIYDQFIGKRILNDYYKILPITKWEIPILKKLGVKDTKIEYVPNGIPEEFFSKKIKIKGKSYKKILFLGRLSPIKNIETLIRAFAIVKEKFPNVKLELAGPIEEGYGDILSKVIKETGVDAIFSGPVYDLNKKIDLIDSCDIFILPSLREAMPQALIEGMSRNKLVISSDTDGGKEIVHHMKNGLLFKIGDEKDLAEKILFALDEKNNEQIKNIAKNARSYVKQFAWKSLIKKIERLILESQ